MGRKVDRLPVPGRGHIISLSSGRMRITVVRLLPVTPKLHAGLAARETAMRQANRPCTHAR